MVAGRLSAFPLLAAGAYTVLLGFLSVVPRPPALVPDSWAHGAATAIQAALFYAAAAPFLSPLGSLVSAWLGTVVFSGLYEFLQYLFPPRTPELRDLVSGALGAALALCGVVLAKRCLSFERSLRVNTGSSGNTAEPARESSGVAEIPPAGPSCIHCREPIQPGAARCPRCLAWQSRWAADAQNPRLELLLLLVGTALVVAVALWLARVGTVQKPAANPKFTEGAIVVLEASPVAFGSGERRGLAVVGRLSNSTSTAWRDPYVQVECYDGEGRVTEAFATRVTSLVVPSFGRGVFKVIEPNPLRDPKESVRCSVEVRWAARAE